MGAAGLMALHRDDPGLRFVLIHVTDGEAGEIAQGSGATRETLGAVRREEDRRGWEVVGKVPDRHEWFGFPDGGVADLAPGYLADRIAAVFEEERPDVVLSFGPDGVTGHPDHIAVGAATDEAFMRFVGTPGPGIQRLWHGAYEQSAFDRVNARRVAAGKPPMNPNNIYEPRPVPDAEIGCTLDQTSVVDIIRRAFQAHRSQWAPPWSDYEERGWTSSAGASHMVQAWPPWTPGTPRLSDPLEGLL